MRPEPLPVGVCCSRQTHLNSCPGDPVGPVADNEGAMDTGSTFAATIQVTPEIYLAWVQLSGDVDLAAEDRLEEILQALSATEIRDIYIDLLGVAFAGTSLLTFLVRAGAVEALYGPPVLYRTPPNIRRIIEAVGLHKIVMLGDNERVDHQRSMPEMSEL
jgi:anti-anti-sigma factor